MHESEMSGVFGMWLVLVAVPYQERNLQEAQDTINMLCMGGEL